MTSTSQALFSCVRQTLPAPSFCPSICPLFTWEKPGPQNSGPDMSPASHDVEDKAGGSWDGTGKRREQTMWKFGCCHLPLPISPCPTSSPKRQCHCPAPSPGKGDFLCKALGPFLHLFLFPFLHLFLSSPLPPFPFPLVLASSILPSPPFSLLISTWWPPMLHTALDCCIITKSFLIIPAWRR